MTLHELVRAHGCRAVTVAGLAKNTGKTVTFNQLIAEAHAAGDRLLLASFGHDGEYRDVFLQHRKPGITAPPGAIYVTAEQWAGEDTARETLGATGFRTLFGAVKVFRAGAGGAHIQLCGLNRTSRLRTVQAMPVAGHDLFLIDGAIDRRAAAVPDIADGVILATGAALGSRDEIVAATTAAVARLTVGASGSSPAPEPPADLPPDAAWAVSKGEIRILANASWIAGRIPDGVEDLREGDTLNLGGALTVPLASRLLALPQDVRFALVVPDGTRIFVPPETLSRLAHRGVPVSVRRVIRLLAVTVNPFNPWGEDLSSDELEAAVRDALPGVPVFDVRSPRYPGPAVL